MSTALRGAILAELAWRGRIYIPVQANHNYGTAAAAALAKNGVVLVRNASKTGEPLLDEALATIAAESHRGAVPQPLAHWLQVLSGDTWNLTQMAQSLKNVRERLMMGLVEKGVLSVHETTLTKLLETGAAKWRLRQPAAKTAVVKAVQAALLPPPDRAKEGAGKESTTAVTAAVPPSVVILCCLARMSCVLSTAILQPHGGTTSSPKGYTGAGNAARQQEKLQRAAGRLLTLVGELVADTGGNRAEGDQQGGSGGEIEQQQAAADSAMVSSRHFVAALAAHFMKIS
eukprot:COSAG06_NODE_11655_length_1481_cov_0.934877_2_plen_287_part_00